MMLAINAVDEVEGGGAAIVAATPKVRVQKPPDVFPEPTHIWGRADQLVGLGIELLERKWNANGF
jgi:hypothetical protein